MAFQTLLMDFIDDELTPAERSVAISHAAACPDCRTALKEAECVRKALVNLPRHNVTSEFDFRLKASIRLESRRLRNPFYRFQVFFRENMAAMAVMPVAAVVMLSGALMYPGFPGHDHSVVTNTTGTRSESHTAVVPGVPETRSEDVHYVLESVELSEVGLDSVHDKDAGGITPDTHTISLLSF